MYVCEQEKTLGVLATWVETLHGHGDFDDLSRTLSSFADCEIAAIGRHIKGTEKAQTVGFHDRAGKRILSRPFPGAFGSALLGESLFMAKAGHFWRYSEVADGLPREARDRIALWLDHRNLSELTVLTLETSPRMMDFVEFHDARGVDASRTAARLKPVARTLTQAWARRASGVVSRRLAAKRVQRRLRAADGGICPLLGPDNPAGLSRSEFRVCTLVEQGLTARRIAVALGISEATVRSHLAAIFAKTGAEGQVELMSLLAGAPGKTEIASANRRRA